MQTWWPSLHIVFRWTRSATAWARCCTPYGDAFSLVSIKVAGLVRCVLSSFTLCRTCEGRSQHGWKTARPDSPSAVMLGSCPARSTSSYSTVAKVRIHVPSGCAPITFALTLFCRSKHFHPTSGQHGIHVAGVLSAECPRVMLAREEILRTSTPHFRSERPAPRHQLVRKTDSGLQCSTSTSM